MNGYLLDTHVFLWWVGGSERLSSVHRGVLEEPASEIWLSVVSVWEATIKAATGKLQLPGPPFEFFTEASAECGFRILPIQLAHAAGVASLPSIHSDPFDRLLISQARHERFILLSDDSAVRGYHLDNLRVI